MGDDQNEPDVSLSEAGHPIYHYKTPDYHFDPAIGDGKLIDYVAAHIERYVGSEGMVFHERISTLVHIDVHWVRPTPEHNFHTLITSGMSQRPMNVPEGANHLRYAEVMLCLPPSWQISLEAFKDENNYFPVRLLKTLARFPHEYNTWLGLYHSTSNGDPPTPYASNTQLCCAMLFRPMLFEEDFWELRIDDDKLIHFYSVIPLYMEERDYKFKLGGQALMEKWLEQDIVEVLDPGRINTVLSQK